MRVAEEDVVGLEVAVDDAARVHVAEAAGDAEGDLDDLCLTEMLETYNA